VVLTLDHGVRRDHGVQIAIGVRLSESSARSAMSRAQKGDRPPGRAMRTTSRLAAPRAEPEPWSSAGL
jgi:hypothetical protein